MFRISPQLHILCTSTAKRHCVKNNNSPPSAAHGCGAHFRLMVTFGNNRRPF